MNAKTIADRAAEIYVDPYPGRKGSERVSEDCGFCLGTGIYQGKSGLKIYTATVADVDKGCFKCWGTGKISFLVSSARASRRRQAKIQAENEAREVEWKVRREALYAAQLELRIALAGLAEFPARAVPEGLAHAALLAAEGQVWDAEEADRIQAELDAFKAARAALGAVPETDKRIEVQGEVLAVKFQEGYMPGSGSYKMLLQCEGYKLWGSVPSGLGAERGDKVAFMARVERSGDDPAFGFFSRPTKARTL